MPDIPELSVSTITREDLPDLLSLIREFAAFENVLNLGLCAGDLERCFFTEPIGTAFLCRSQGVACAFATGSPLLTTYQAKQSFWIDTVYVHADYRRRGIGQTLFLAISEYAVKHDLIYTEWSCDRGNDTAAAFYEKIGAAELPWNVYRLSR